MQPFVVAPCGSPRLRSLGMIVLVGTALVVLGLGPSQAAEPAGDSAPKRLLLLGQKPDGHPKATHEYLPGQKVLAQCLKDVPGLKVEVVQADNPWHEGPDVLAKADGVVLFVSEGAKWVTEDPRRLEAFIKLADRKGGLCVFHWGMGTREPEPIDPFVKLFGACHGGPDRKFKFLKAPEVRLGAKHPILTGVDGLHPAEEEFYFRLKTPNPRPDGWHSLVELHIDGQHETVSWAWQRPDGGRSFGFSGLHFHNNWRLPVYRRLLSQAALWTLDLPIPPSGFPVDLPDSAFELE